MTLENNLNTLFQEENRAHLLRLLGSYEVSNRKIPLITGETREELLFRFYREKEEFRNYLEVCTSHPSIEVLKEIGTQQITREQLARYINK